MKTYKVSEVSKIMGISSHTLRYWDRIGLLNFVGRDEHGNRAFKRTDFLALRTITCMKSTGMHLHYIDLCEEGLASAPERLKIMEDQQAEIEKQIEDLKGELITIKQKVDYYKEAIKENDLDVYQDEFDEWLDQILGKEN